MAKALASLQKRENIPELLLVRAMAIIGVLSVHSTSFATVDMVNSNYFFLYNFFNIFMKIGTTTFIFLSSFVLFYNYYSRPLDKQLLGSFYKKRLLYIIIPYLVFSLFYFTILHFTYYPDRSLSTEFDIFIDKILTGKAYTHLYFVYINIQFYLMFPLFLWLMKKYPRTVKWAIPTGIALQWGFFMLNKYGLETPVPNRGSWSFSYFSYYLLGAALGIYYPKIKQWVIIAREHATAARVATWIALWVCWIAAGLTHVYLYYETRLHRDSFNTTLFDLVWNIHGVLTALVLIQLSFILSRKLPKVLTRLIARLGALSFGIYLIHPFFLLVYRQYPLDTGTAWLLHFWYLGGFALALIGSWIVVGFFARYVPFNWIAFGNLPRPKKRPAQPVLPERQLDA
ncbi:Peptidoglycan/LPS O-acetylase OafA/YrhL, contains acyltransferase and SGNH-hydrolase domains [Paenibacillus catalpae]|uniref:Peptidoglycan/LPS O-acetylase OafA/YrhL, contains acyltransferase and SGNH-hydrolase domains n=1 Tax=Paenibacillus catalpae TaxID=1045775 RepID=A0A1I1XX86_9BACL|nr:acyltransferase [Paenibacillus catalpae]SFE11819.1 Peptidoglycan/LPS O-acetylase OafA/YrhL, contains acyltransferase and SGNH-hydrolase domains [Paenibacillus catalpae]